MCSLKIMSFLITVKKKYRKSKVFTEESTINVTKFNMAFYL